MFVLVFAAMLGGVVTVVMLAPHSLLLALLWAPIGGSCLTFIAGLLLLLRRTRAPPSQVHKEKPLTVGLVKAMSLGNRARVGVSRSDRYHSLHLDHRGRSDRRHNRRG